MNSQTANHDEFRELLTLSCFGELSAGDQQRLDQHLAQCPDCRAELEELVRIREAYGADFRQVSEPLLRQAREELDRAMEARRRRLPAGLSAGLRRWLRPVFAGAAAGLVGAGFLAGYLAFSGRGAEAPFDLSTGQYRISNLIFEEEPDGRIRLTFTASRPVRIEGTLEDPDIQKVLAYALVSESNPGVRLRAVGAFAAQTDPQADREVVNALIGALRTDSNPAVRLLALQALRSYPADPEVKRAGVDTLLHDSNARLRLEAIAALQSLVERGVPLDEALVKELDQGLDRQHDEFVQRKARELLQRAGYGRF
jgi:hypothetical protein